MSELLETIKAANLETFSNDVLRKTAVQEIHSLLSRIETPWETAWRLAMIFPAENACVKIAIDLKLFPRWLELNNGGPTSFDDLARLVPECDLELLLRVIRVLSSTNVVWSDNSGNLSMSPFATSLVHNDMASVIESALEFGTPPTLHSPEFLASINYQSPNGVETDNFKHYSGQPVWEYLTTRPSVTVTLGRYMKVSGESRGTFSAIYPPAAQLTGTKDEVLVVDIGGNIGHDLQAFKKKYPDSVGSLVLQDLPEVINNAPELDRSITKMGYDFFTEQPVKGARVYHLHSVLHDWPDHDAKRILETVRPALKPGHSKLLIEETVIPNIKPDSYSAIADWAMMALASGKERTEQQWQNLLNSAGFKIIKIWRHPLYAETIIECEVAELAPATVAATES